MASAANYFTSTIGRKQIMAVAGLGLSLFVLGHAAGNLLMFVGPEAYNIYGHNIVSNPLIYVIEGGLLAIFLAHVFAGVSATIKNRCARKDRYAKAATGEKATSLVSKTMALQGVVLLVFVGIHLWTFKYGAHYEVNHGGQTVRDLFRLVYEAFQSPIYTIWYVVALVLLSGHLAHGVYSALQTLGFHHPKYSPKLKCVSVLYGLFVGGAFISQPIYMMFFYKG